DNASVEREMGRARFLQADTPGAVRLLQAAHSKAPNDEETASLLAQYLAVQHQYPAAVEVVRDSIGRHPDNGKLKLLLAYLLLQARDRARLPEVVSVVGEAIRQGAAGGEAYYYLGQAYTEMNRPEDAVAAYRQGYQLE